MNLRTVFNRFMSIYLGVFATRCSALAKIAISALVFTTHVTPPSNDIYAAVSVSPQKLSSFASLCLFNAMSDGV